MKLNFNTQGFLHETIVLTSKEFEHHFATNPLRKEQIHNALHFFAIFNSCGCQTVYVDGSFASLKMYPGDIDLCFDLTDLDADKLEREFPQFFDPNEIGKIHRSLSCHIFYFDRENQRFLRLLETDRDGNSKGLVKLDLTDLLTYYDQKRKTI